MKIAILSTIGNYEWAGTEEVWAQFAIAALKQGHKVMLGAHHRVAKSERVAELKELGLQIVERKPFNPVRLYLLKERLISDMQQLVNFQPDILLINSGSLYDVTNLPYLYQLCQKIQSPKVFFCHFVAETLRDENISFVRSFFEGMSSVVFVSDHNRHLAERQIASRFKQSTVIMNGPRLLLQAPLPWPGNDTIQMACVARFETSWKGHDVLLDVLSAPVWKGRKWHLNLYGSGPDESYIKSLVSLYDLDDRVTFRGYIKSIREVWTNNHIKVLASRGEGTPLAVLEAMMCGRPVVTTDAGGNREIIEQGKTGWVADAATGFSFGEMLEAAWQQVDRWAEMGEMAHKKALILAGDNPPVKLLDYLKSMINVEL